MERRVGWDDGQLDTDELGHYNMEMLYVNIGSKHKTNKDSSLPEKEQAMLSPLMAFDVMVIDLTGVPLVA